MSDDFVMLLVMFSVSATVNLGLAIAWFRVNKRLRQIESRPVALAQVQDLPARVDSALDAITGRLDEFASAQDFMNRVVIERLEKLNRALPAPEP
jgi:biopolymer transport protein ExbB/TolQ